MTPRTPSAGPGDDPPDPPGRYGRTMCRSIKTLRPPYAEQVTDDDIRAAALQYVRKISGFRAPAGHNAEAFGHAVDAVAAATAELLGELKVRSASRVG
jgi:hypothetical protein